METINTIEIGSKWEDTLGMAKYSSNGSLLKGRLKKEVIITDKSSNTIEYVVVNTAYKSWISIEDFTRIERSNNKSRFERI
jgi:hypothetical protein